MATRIQVRRGTNTQWNTTDPVLNEGEFGYSTTDSQFKIGDGSTIWSELDYVPSATSLGSSLGDYIELTEKGAIDGVAELDGSKNILAPAGIIFEGTADAYETTLSVTDPTADRTITLPNTSGTVITTGNLSDITNIGTFSSTITMEGSTENDFELTLSAGDPTADRTITFPDATGTVALTTDITFTAASTSTVTNKSISLSTNTITGTIAEFNTAVTDANLATTSDLSSYATLSGATFTGAISGTSLTLSGDLTINGTTTTINSTTLTVDDKNIVLADGNTSDASADGGGITLSGATSKTFNWIDATDAWTSSEHMNLLTGKSYKINNTAISASRRCRTISATGLNFLLVTGRPSSKSNVAFIHMRSAIFEASLTLAVSVLRRNQVLRFSSL